MQKYFSGLSGLILPVRKFEYPEEFRNSSRLRYYSSIFNSIEINSSFYKVPLPKTIERWSLDTAEDFRFTFKVWKQITHNQGFTFHETDIYSFLFSVASIGIKKGCLLIQLPPSNGFENFHQLSNVFSVFSTHNKSGEWNIVVEFRNSSWYREEVYELCAHFNISVVVHDMKASRTPLIASDNPVRYVRFHGPTGNYRGSYENAYLDEYAGYISEWLQENKIVYVYFNNTAGDAFNNLQTLNRFVHERSQSI